MNTNLSDKENLDAFLESIGDRADWLTVVRFGLPTLLDDQLFLFELMAKRGVKESRLNQNQNLVGYIAGVFEDLDLKLAAKEKPEAREK